MQRGGGEAQTLWTKKVMPLFFFEIEATRKPFWQGEALIFSPQGESGITPKVLLTQIDVRPECNAQNLAD